LGVSTTPDKIETFGLNAIIARMAAKTTAETTKVNLFLISASSFLLQSFDLLCMFSTLRLPIDRVEAGTPSCVHGHDRKDECFNPILEEIFPFCPGGVAPLSIWTHRRIPVTTSLPDECWPSSKRCGISPRLQQP
jgi:hypothetical protein